MNHVENQAAGFTAVHSEMRDRTLEEGQIQGGVKARRVMQDLMIRDKGKERKKSAGSSRKQQKPDLDLTS